MAKKKLPITCTPKSLPGQLPIEAAANAIRINPANRPNFGPAAALFAIPTDRQTEFISAVTTKYWHGLHGVHLTVSFLDAPESALKRVILSNMNAWSKNANIKFVETKGEGQVRIARTAGDGYWSYLGVDILSIRADEPTMNLDSFTVTTPVSEFHRVVRHETGHTLGFPHEHLRKEIVNRIDKKKAIAYFAATSGWSAATTKAQVLTPLDPSKLLATRIDQDSIMCYQLPGTIMKDAKPVPGGKDIDKTDYDFASALYPK